MALETDQIFIMLIVLSVVIERITCSSWSVIE